MSQGAVKEASDRASRALTLAKEGAGNKQLVAQVMHLLGRIAMDQGDSHHATQRISSALDIARSIDDLHTVSHAASSLSQLDATCGGRGEHYAARKAQRLTKHVASAASNDLHRQIRFASIP